MDIIWVCNICGEELIQGEEIDHDCFNGATELYQVGDTNRLCVLQEIATDSVPVEKESSEGKKLIETVDVNELLILEVQKRPGLYNHKLPLEQRNRQMVIKLWREVFDQLRGQFREVQDVQVCWQTLRDRFVKEFAYQTTPKKTGTGRDDVHKTIWKYYSILLFLKDIVQPRKTVSNLCDVDEAHIQDMNENTACAPLASPLSIVCVASPSPSPSGACSGPSSSGASSGPSSAAPSGPSLSVGNKRKIEKLNLTEKLIEAFNESSHVPDETDAFCTRLAASLRRLPRKERTKYYYFANLEEFVALIITKVTQ